VDTLEVSFEEALFEISGDTILCSDATGTLSVDGVFLSYQWSTGSNAASIVISSPGDYAVTVMDATGCIGADTITVVSVSADDNFGISGDSIICAGISATVQATAGYDPYQWSNGETGQSIVVSEPGVYWCMATDSNGCETIGTIQVEQVADSFSMTHAWCSIDSMILTLDHEFATYLWSDSSQASSLTIYQPGNFAVTVTTSNGCLVSGEIMVTEGQITAFDLGNDITIVSGETLQLSLPDDFELVSWEPAGLVSCPHCIIITTAPLSTTTYYATGYDESGCAFTDSLTVFVINCESQLSVPNAFTPNGDGLNDVLHVLHTEAVTLHSLKIFNRWGELVFQTNDPFAGWNGEYKNRPQELGVYVYVIEFQCASQLQWIKGNVTLLR
jgi:gliding motility-associated-like protein